MKTRLIRLYSDIDKLEINLKDLLKELEVSDIIKERILTSLGLFIDELIDSTERYLEEDEYEDFNESSTYTNSKIREWAREDWEVGKPFSPEDYDYFRRLALDEGIKVTPEDFDLYFKYYDEFREGIEESFKPDAWRVVYIFTGRGGKTRHSARNNIAGLQELIKTIRFYNRDVLILGEFYTPEEAINFLKMDIEELRKGR